MGLRFAVLGTLEVRDEASGLVDLGGAQPRTVLAILLAARGRAVTAEGVIDAVWGDAPPATASGTLQSYVSRLRRALEPDRKPREAPLVLVSTTQGYRLDATPDAVDAWRFEALADEGRSALADGRPADAIEILRRAEDLWRGRAFAEHREAEFARGVAARLEERRLAVLEQRLEAGLALGHVAEVAAEATEAVRAEPLREGLWATLALALYRSGRQADALRALGDARTILVEELGVEPGRSLRDLEADILAQSPALDATPTPARAASPGSSTSAGSPTPPSDAEVAGGSADAMAEAPLLVGRQAETETLAATLAEARRATRFVVVEGEPGIGKTRLLETVGARARADGWTVVWGRTHESGAAPAYWPWLGALRELVAHHPDLHDGLDPLLAPTIDAGARTEAGPTSFRLHEAVATALEAAGRVRPIVVVLDDVQWADPASLDLLVHLATRLVDAPVVVALTLRTAEVGTSDAVTTALSALARRQGSRRLTLRGLDAADSSALLDATAGRAVAQPVAAAIHARSGGNPFFAAELVRLLAAEDLLTDADSVARTPVPAGVRDVVRRRLDRLPTATLDVLRIAAVLGRDLELPILTAASEATTDEILDALEPAVAQRLLVDAPAPPAMARFAHALVRDVLVDDMTTLRRARLHLRAADALIEIGAGDDAAELIAEHLWAAAPVGAGQRAADALEHAARVAVRRAAFATAEDLLRRSLSLRRAAGSSPEAMGAELATLMNLAGVTRSLHGYIAILSLVDRGKELADALGQRDLLTNLLWAEWAAADTACDFARADPLAERFRAMAETAGDDDLVSLTLGQGVWGISCWHHGRIGEAAVALDASRAAAARLPAEELNFGIVSEQRLLTEVFAVHVHDLVGDLDDPATAYELPITSEQDRFARAMIAAFEGAAATAIGDSARAGRASRAGLAADPDVAFSFWGSMSQMYLAGAMLAEGGDPDDAIATFEDGHDRFERAGTRVGLGLVYAMMTLGLVRVGRRELARPYLALAQDELATHHERWPEPVIVLAEAELLAAGDGDPAEVDALLARGEALARAQGAHAVAARLASALHRSRREARSPTGGRR